ncbi:hypothetical protein TNCV_4795501 [Trichonephila clavipes]|nr:hypothetical protein TNCV_4795501 [Trichonephila clavipes]
MVSLFSDIGGYQSPQAFSFGRPDCKNSPQSHIVRVYDAGLGKSGVFHSAEWHVGDWSSDGIREAWLRFFIWVYAMNSYGHIEKKMSQEEWALTKILKQSLEMYVISFDFKKQTCYLSRNMEYRDQGDTPEVMDEILTTARDLELEVNEDDIKEPIMGHEVNSPVLTDEIFRFLRE